MSEVVRRVVKVHLTPHFERSFHSLPPTVQRLAAQRDTIFQNNAFGSSLRTHPLRGKLKGLWSYSVNYRYRILFEFINDREVLYHDIGSHSIYR